MALRYQRGGEDEHRSEVLNLDGGIKLLTSHSLNDPLIVFVSTNGSAPTAI